jgi:hypothetical protein
VTSEAATAAALSAVLLQVTPENVLEVRQTLYAAAQRINAYVTQSVVGAQYVGLCGGDPVSEQAQLAFSDRIAQTAENVTMFGVQLEWAVVQLEKIAVSYGYTEIEIKMAFSSRGDRA